MAEQKEQQVNGSSSLPVLAVDMDEVLCGTVQALVNFHNERFDTKLMVKPAFVDRWMFKRVLGKSLTDDEELSNPLSIFLPTTHLNYRDFNSYKYEEVWGGTPAQAVEKVRLFYDSDHFSDRMQPVPGAYESLRILKSYYRLVIVTSRQEVVHEETHSFVKKHYPDIFDELHFANHHLTVEEAARMVSKTKSQLCKEVGAKILIDDALSHAMDCSANGIFVYLFDHEGAYMWNKLAEDAKLPPNVQRVHSWDDIVQALIPPPSDQLTVNSVAVTPKEQKNLSKSS
ncbi:hypothetical protein HDU76_001788 [Blyttiomyces sp. JEL0837]|nr:hypothetical protein HDU76_001788 [Blyttiomyces sp. JEL0837]